MILDSGGSGLAVVGPPSGDPRDLLDRIVNQAREQQPPDSSHESGGDQGIEVTLYRNGFTVNDGPLRDLVSPENRAFLDALQSGVVPQGEAEVDAGGIRATNTLTTGRC